MRLFRRAFPIIFRRSMSSTASREEIGRFSELAADWWNETGSLKALHTFNDIRVLWIRDTLIQHESFVKWRSPLENYKIIDVGCGAGILCEPLSRLGADVTGLDAASDCVSVAKTHAEKDSAIRQRIRYLVGSVEELLPKEENQFDAVVASEVLEHVENREEFIRSCVRLTKPGGFLFFTTINRTIWSKIFGVFVAEKILRVVPEGIHEWEKFTPPEDLEFLVENEGCGVRLVHGLSYNPFSNKWQWIDSQRINYALRAVKFC